MMDLGAPRSGSPACAHHLLNRATQRPVFCLRTPDPTCYATRMSTLDTFGAEYLRITFGVERHFPGFIDAYVGPQELRAEADSAPPPTVADLTWIGASLTCARICNGRISPRDTR